VFRGRYPRSRRLSDHSFSCRRRANRNIDYLLNVLDLPSAATSRSYSTLSSSVGVTWSRPLVISSRFLRGSVGRADELEHLHSVLTANDVAEKESDQTENSWTGKTVLTLTAMYADPAKIGYYPGGVLWLTLGPNKVTLDDFGSDLYWLFLKIGN
jgi:hypothetical protein